MKQIVYESPKLTIDSGDLICSNNGEPFVCIRVLESLFEFPEAEATEYWIEASTKPWRDGRCWKISVLWRKYGDRQKVQWSWASVAEELHDDLYPMASAALNATNLPADLPQGQPVDIYIRLTYCE